MSAPSPTTLKRDAPGTRTDCQLVSATQLVTSNGGTGMNSMSTIALVCQVDGIGVNSGRIQVRR